MTLSITHRSPISLYNHKIPSSKIIHSNDFQRLTLSEKLQSIGLIDNNFKIRFIPTEIEAISQLGQNRFKQLMDLDVQCLTEKGDVLASLKHSEYISGFKKVLAESGFGTRTYLRGGYAVYVACLGDYFEYFIKAFLKDKEIKANFADEIAALKKQDHEAIQPSDVDLLEHVLNDAFSPEAFRGYHFDFLAKYGDKKKIRDQGLRQLLIPEASDAFPFEEKYVLFTTGNATFQTDRIIGRLHHEYLYTRDDIRIEIKNNQMCVPESAGNFWQMVIDRTLKIVRTESWHEQDFRSGLAAIQLIQNNHILIDEACTLESIIKHALLTKSDLVFSCAISRAKLHGKDTYGFLMSVLIAYSHVASLNQYIIPDAHLKILTDAILETKNKLLPLGSLYRLAHLLTFYEDQTGVYRSEWDKNGFLILSIRNSRIIFPKNFNKEAEESLVPYTLKRRTCTYPKEPIYDLLESNVSINAFERVLYELVLQKPLPPFYELVLQKPLPPFSESFKDALISFLLSSSLDSERKLLASLMSMKFSNDYTNMEWILALLNDSFKHAIKLWKHEKTKMNEDTKWINFEKIIRLMEAKRPNQAYALIEEESPPKPLRLNLLKILTKSLSISPHTSLKIFEELSEKNALEDFIIRAIENLPGREGFIFGEKLPHTPKLLLALDRLISKNKVVSNEDEEWFFNSNPSQERIRALYLNFVSPEDEEWFFKSNSNPDHDKVRALHIANAKKQALKLLIKWIEQKAPEDKNEAIATFLYYKGAILTLPEIYTQFIKQFQLADVAREWIDSHKIPDRQDLTLAFFSQYNSNEHPLLENICSLPGVDKIKLMEFLSSKGLPVFSNRDFKDLLSLLNINFSPPIKEVILNFLADHSPQGKELDALQKWMKTNPSLSPKFISNLLEKENVTLLPLIIQHQLALKSRNASFDPSLWKKTLDLSFVNPSTLHELIPFFQNRKWLESTYGASFENETEKWGSLLNRSNLTKLELDTIDSILSRTQLKITPLIQIKFYLESLYNQNLVQDNMIEIFYQKTLETILEAIKNHEEQRFHNLHVLFKLIKLESKLNLTSFDRTFSLIENRLKYIPIFRQRGFIFNPLFYHIQHLPLVDYGSRERYNDWIGKRNAIMLQWKEIPLVNDEDPQVVALKNLSIRVLPYELMLESLKYAHQFKLLTELYLDNQIQKSEFEKDIKELSISVSQTFKDQEELFSSEDPGLICIDELSCFLKVSNKRLKAYEAFDYILSQWPNKLENKWSARSMQRTYLKVREKTETLMIKKTTLLEKNKILYSEYLDTLLVHLKETIPELTNLHLHILDPISDALEFPSISLLNKIDLKRIWLTTLNESNIFNIFQSIIIKGRIDFKSDLLIESAVSKYYEKRVDALKGAIKRLSENAISAEIAAITTSAVHNLSKEPLDLFKKYLEEKLSKKISYTET